VELWTRINAESEMLRRRVTPVHVQQRIMASLPGHSGTATNWWKQQVTITPVSAIAIGVALPRGWRLDHPGAPLELNFV